MSVDHLWGNECEAESDGGDSGTEYNERKRNIIQSREALRFSMEKDEIPTYMEENPTDDFFQKSCYYVENFRIYMRMFGMTERQPSGLVINTCHFLQTFSTKKEEKGELLYY